MQFFVDQKYTVNLHFLMHESIPKKNVIWIKMLLQLVLYYILQLFSGGSL